MGENGSRFKLIFPFGVVAGIITAFFALQGVFAVTEYPCDTPPNCQPDLVGGSPKGLTEVLNTEPRGDASDFVDPVKIGDETHDATVEARGFQLNRQPVWPQMLLRRDSQGNLEWFAPDSPLPKEGVLGDTLRFNTDSILEKNNFLFNSGSRIGIGTAKPEELVEINGGTGVGGHLLIAEIDAEQNPEFQLQFAPIGEEDGKQHWSFYANRSDGSLRIKGSGAKAADRLIIGKSGQLGIGTYNESSGVKVDVAGNFRVMGKPAKYNYVQHMDAVSGDNPYGAVPKTESTVPVCGCSGQDNEPQPECGMRYDSPTDIGEACYDYIGGGKAVRYVKTIATPPVPFFTANIGQGGSQGIGINTAPLGPNTPLNVGGKINTNAGFCIGDICRDSWDSLSPWKRDGNDIYYDKGGVGIGGPPKFLLDLIQSRVSQDSSAIRLAQGSTKLWTGLRLDRQSGEEKWFVGMNDGGPVHIDDSLRIRRAGQTDDVIFTEQGLSIGTSRAEYPLEVSAGGSNDIFFFQNASNATALVLTGDGKVGIGTKTPQSAFDLVLPQVSKSAIRLAMASTGVAEDDKASYFFRVRNSGAVAFVARGDGRVGVGTGDPQGTLHIAGQKKVWDTPLINDVLAISPYARTDGPWKFRTRRLSQDVNLKETNAALYYADAAFDIAYGGMPVMSISNTGNVALGRNAVAGSNRLFIDGNVRAMSVYTSAGYDENSKQGETKVYRLLSVGQTPCPCDTTEDNIECENWVSHENDPDLCWDDSKLGKKYFRKTFLGGRIRATRAELGAVSTTVAYLKGGQYDPPTVVAMGATTHNGESCTQVCKKFTKEDDSCVLAVDHYKDQLGVDPNKKVSCGTVGPGIGCLCAKKVQGAPVPHIAEFCIRKPNDKACYTDNVTIKKGDPLAISWKIFDVTDSSAVVFSNQLIINILGTPVPPVINIRDTALSKETFTSSEQEKNRYYNLEGSTTIPFANLGYSEQQSRGQYGLSAMTRAEGSNKSIAFNVKESPDITNFSIYAGEDTANADMAEYWLYKNTDEVTLQWNTRYADYVQIENLTSAEYPNPTQKFPAQGAINIRVEKGVKKTYVLAAHIESVSVVTKRPLGFSDERNHYGAWVFGKPSLNNLCFPQKEKVITTADLGTDAAASQDLRPIYKCTGKKMLCYDVIRHCMGMDIDDPKAGKDNNPVVCQTDLPRIALKQDAIYKHRLVICGEGNADKQDTDLHGVFNNNFISIGSWITDIGAMFSGKDSSIKNTNGGSIKNGFKYNENPLERDLFKFSPSSDFKQYLAPLIVFDKKDGKTVFTDLKLIEELTKGVNGYDDHNPIIQSMKLEAVPTTNSEGDQIGTAFVMKILLSQPEIKNTDRKEINVIISGEVYDYMPGQRKFKDQKNGNIWWDYPGFGGG